MPTATTPPYEVTHWGLSIASGFKFDPAVIVAQNFLYTQNAEINGNNTLNPAHGNFEAPFIDTPNFAPDLGMGPAPVIAQNNTLGSFDPYQGRVHGRHLFACHPAPTTVFAWRRPTTAAGPERPH